MHQRTKELIQRNAAWFEGEERPLQEQDMKRAIYLFSASAIGGVLFNLTDEEVKAKLEEGWADSPAGFAPAASDPVVSAKGELDSGVCPHCGKPIAGKLAAPPAPALPEGGTVTDGPLLAAFKAKKQLNKAKLVALGVELGIHFVPDDMTNKQMAEEIQAFLDTPALGGK